jgi:antitoxin PrlF
MQAISKLTRKYQATIPKKVREALGLQKGDSVIFEIEGDSISLRRATTLDLQYLQAIESTMSEWLSDNDDEAYRDL